MKVTIIHIGLDVDDAQYHGSAFYKGRGVVVDFKYRPALKSLLVHHVSWAGIFRDARSRSGTRVLLPCRLVWHGGSMKVMNTVCYRHRFLPVFIQHAVWLYHRSV